MKIMQELHRSDSPFCKATPHSKHFFKANHLQKTNKEAAQKERMSEKVIQKSHK
jgi:hypothetical protein